MHFHILRILYFPELFLIQPLVHLALLYTSVQFFGIQNNMSHAYIKPIFNVSSMLRHSM